MQEIDAEEIDDEYLFKPIHSPIDVDSCVMDDDVFNIMFETHPIDKREFTPKVNISPETSTQSRPVPRQSLILPDMTDTSAQKPLDLSLGSSKKRKFPWVKDADSGISPKSNEVCLMFYSQHLLFDFWKCQNSMNKSNYFFLNFFETGKKWTFEEKKKRIASKYKPSW